MVCVEHPCPPFHAPGYAPIAGGQHVPALNESPQPHMIATMTPRASASAHQPQLASLHGSFVHVSVQPCLRVTFVIT